MRSWETEADQTPYLERDEVKETKETIRKCNSLNTDKSNPDCVAFIGWEH